MVTLTDDEVALIRSLLTALRGIKVRDIRHLQKPVRFSGTGLQVFP